MGKSIEESAFIKACYGRNSGTIPIWIMRQAGRYLPEYRAIREKVSFTELCHSPDLISEVVQQPIRRFDLDAAILFSDILTVLEPMGMEFEFPNGGPRLTNPISTPGDIDRLRDCDIKRDLPFVLQGIREIKKAIPEKPLIGFVGSPITLACYLIEGGGSKTFNSAKRFLHEHSEAGQRLLDKLTEVTARYLRAQIEAGCDVVQVFDSWGGILSQEDYRDLAVPRLNEIFRSLRDLSVPRILFVNNISPYLSMVSQIDCDVVGIDYRMDLREAFEALPGKAIQGNFDPSALFEESKSVAARAQKLLDDIAEPERFIFNLGHGVLPETPISSIEALVSTVRDHKVDFAGKGIRKILSG